MVLEPNHHLQGGIMAQQAKKAEESKPTPQAVKVEPPKMEGRGKTAIHTPEVIEAIAKAAAEGWTSNNLTYKTKHGAQGALQTVKEAIVKGGFAASTSDLAGRVWESSPDEYVFAVGAKAAVRSE